VSATSETRPHAEVDVGAVLSGLKRFQRDTVAHVVDRLYGEDPVDRFLVADEVGLGKTLVAKGVLALAIERIRETRGGRIDVVYLCSSQDIARQNVARLNPTGLTELAFDRRLTMLPRVFRDLRRNPINLVALTPGTSFNLRSAEGQRPERLLLYHLLRRCWGAEVVRDTRPDQRVFQGSAGFAGIVRDLARHADRDLDDDLVHRFRAALDRHAAEARAAGRVTLEDRYLELRDDLRWLRAERPPREVAVRRRELIGDVRELLARTCIEVLDPSLVILDEFQRFRDLLDGADDTATLASSLFRHRDVKVLLLSATPYKMYTVRDELHDDHHADLLRTVRFLAGDDQADDLEVTLRRFRRELLTATGDGEQVELVAARDRIERTLRRVMVRTERLAVSDHRGGMLVERASRQVRLEPRDVREYLGLERLATMLDAGGIVDYWKSSGYPLNFMEDYQLDRELHRAVEDPDRGCELAQVVENADWLLQRDDVEAFRPLDPGNARLRSLLHELLDDGLWKVAWLPPSLPYHQPGPPFDDLGEHAPTKRLIFSAWRVVPKVIATVLSYEAERRMATVGTTPHGNTPDDRRRFQPLLRLQRSQGRLTGLPVLGLLYPSHTLAALVDPLAHVTDGPPPTLADVEADTQARLAERLASLTSGAPVDGPVDERWYWAVPMLLDLDTSSYAPQDEPWWWRDDLAARWLHADDGERGGRSLAQAHIDQAWEVLVDPGQLGRVPDDLARVVARLALAGPATVALRALRRVAPQLPLDDVELRLEAAAVGWAFRTLFNRPEITWLLRGQAERRGDERAYWRLVLEHALGGNLQAVVDEHAHVLVEWCGVGDHGPGARVAAVAERMREALTTRAVTYRVTDLTVQDGRLRTDESYTMRGQFAVRFGDDRSEQDHSVVRQGHVRTAFNSPYWPYVLATTSVGQEGLDFHLYCHAITHWNLPSNPVDLEQREGRVHRYKGHAIRRNVAQVHRQRATAEGGADPWEAMFAAAEEGADGSDLVPYWIYPVEGGATIERTVPALPLSSEVRQLDELRRTVAAYRMVFGQPRQEDLVAFLRRRHGVDVKRLGRMLRIDLAPPPADEDVLPRPSAAAPAPTWRPPSDAVDLASAPSPSGPLRARYQRFWAGMIDDLLREHPDWRVRRTPPVTSWLVIGNGIRGQSGLHYAIVFASRERLRLELYVDPRAEHVRPVAWPLLTRARERIETTYGEEVLFEELPRRRASRISALYPVPASIHDEAAWPSYREWALAQLPRFRAAIDPLLAEIAERSRRASANRR
jgi:hypothetical protein